jgi:hypothetical protein
MPAVLTGDAAVLARRALPKPEPAPAPKPDPLEGLAGALRQLAAQIAVDRRDTATAAAIAEQSRVTAAALAQLAAMLTKKDAALLDVLKMLERKPETLLMTVESRDSEGRIKTVKLEAR